MKACLQASTGPLDTLRPGKPAEPSPAPGEALLKVEFAALNPADRYLAEGQYPAKPPLPHILGRDGIGTVKQIGPGASDLKIGDRRAGLRGAGGGDPAGTLSPRAGAPWRNLGEDPTGWYH